MKRIPIILTTDFGCADEYVGVVKGVILSINPEAQIIDLTHAIPPQDIRRAASVLGRNHRYFPAGSIHLCIVDPGVGTSGRRIIAVKTNNFYFIGPDNGVFSFVIGGDKAVDIYQVSNRSWFLDEVGSTFHGRDIMAPAAARISRGEPVEAAGPRLSPESCILISPALPICTGDEIIGEVCAIDHFGNLITNIDREQLQALSEKDRFSVQVKSVRIRLHQCSYGDLPDKRPAAIINSSNVVEICVKNGSAAEVLQVLAGEKVAVTAVGRQ